MFMLEMMILLRLTLQARASLSALLLSRYTVADPITNHSDVWEPVLLKPDPSQGLPRFLSIHSGLEVLAFLQHTVLTLLQGCL